MIGPIHLISEDRVPQRDWACNVCAPRHLLSFLCSGSGSGDIMSMRGSHSVKCSYPPRMGQIGHEVGVRMA